MDRQRVDAWLEGYRRAWEQADTPAVLGLFTTDASYRSHPLRPAHTGHDGVAAYWARATTDQQDVRVRFGDPIVDGDRVAVEWWAVMGAGGDPTTLAGCLILTFAAGGRCRELRECWHMAEEILDPPADWDRLDPTRAAAPATMPAAGPRAMRRPGGPATPRRRPPSTPPDVHYRSEAFRDPHLDRDGVLAYTRGAYAAEASQDPRFGTPVAAGSAAAVEWWTTTLEQGEPATLIGTSVLTFTPDGLVATGRDYWFLEPGTHRPFDGWGR
jgi:SnoaL-like domain